MNNDIEVSKFKYINPLYLKIEIKNWGMFELMYTYNTFYNCQISTLAGVSDLLAYFKESDESTIKKLIQLIIYEIVSHISEDDFFIKTILEVDIYTYQIPTLKTFFGEENIINQFDYVNTNTYNGMSRVMLNFKNIFKSYEN